ncbi:hypothetical protein [Pandoraea horticolens]|uniref:hypothetical protein n=1 Tax=Pandoraea horticolens TaxID=2508298 RepID=UPI0012427DCB|nr:hypothetical protein [Pandoraea horticolens]
MIEMGLYRRFYRHRRIPFADAGDGAIGEATTLATPLSISFNYTEQATALHQGDGDLGIVAPVVT